MHPGVQEDSKNIPVKNCDHEGVEMMCGGKEIWWALRARHVMKLKSLAAVLSETHVQLSFCIPRVISW